MNRQEFIEILSKNQIDTRVFAQAAKDIGKFKEYQDFEPIIPLLFKQHRNSLMALYQYLVQEFKNKFSIITINFNNLTIYK